MKTYSENQNFNIVISTKATMFGVVASAFKTHYAPTNNLTDKTVVDGGLSEAVATIATPQTATLSASALSGATVLSVNSGHTIVAGSVVEYTTNKFAYVSKATATKLYLKTKTTANITAGAVVNQVGNSGVYVTPEFSIASAGDYLVTIEAPEFGIMLESRVSIVDTTTEATPIDVDAPLYSEIAVAY